MAKPYMQYLFILFLDSFSWNFPQQILFQEFFPPKPTA